MPLIPNKFRLEAADAILLIVDVQERLSAVMKEQGEVIENIVHLIETAKCLGVPVLLTEQHPKGLGLTAPRIRAALSEYAPIEKITFSCCAAEGFQKSLKALGRKTVILCGMETHVCVLQTCVDLLEDGYAVHVAADCVTSRMGKVDGTGETDRMGATGGNKAVGIEYMRQAGAVVTSCETVMFQLMKRADTRAFKTLSKTIK
jgi:nicotinamidase-related amidase